MAAVRLSETLIIIIAASGFVGCVVILFIIFRCCRRPKSAPLPPIQPLAHHREKEFDYVHRPRVPHSGVGLGQLGVYGSDTSLLKPSRKPSFESNGAPSSGHNSFLTPPQTDVTHQSNLLSVESQSDGPSSVDQQYLSTTRLAHSASRSRLRSQAGSALSLHSTAHTSTRSVNVTRGGHHSSLSNVQIVLPTPLAPQLQTHMVASPAVAGSHAGLMERGGIADRWTTTPGRTTSGRTNTHQDRNVFRGQKNSSSGHRYHRSLDTADQSRRSELQPQFRVRSSSSNSTQSRPPRTLSRRPHDGQARRQSSEEARRSSDRAKTTPRSRSLSHSQQDSPNLQSASQSSHRYTPTSSADTLAFNSSHNGRPPLPAPPLPQSQKPVMPAQHVSPSQFNSITNPRDSSDVFATDFTGRAY